MEDPEWFQVKYNLGMIRMVNKYLYLYLDNKSKTGYVGETKNLKKRHMEHKGDIWPGRRELVSNIDPVIIKTDFNNMNAVWFAEHAVYEKYKGVGYDMLQKPPHPNIFKKYKDRVDSCKICDELGCNFTKERLDYILAVHRVSKLCECCEELFYFDPVKHEHIGKFNKRTYCSKSCSKKGKKKTKESRKKQSETRKRMFDTGELVQWNKGNKCPQLSECQIGEKNHMYGKIGEDNPNYGKKRPEMSGENHPNFGKNLSEESIEKMKGPRPSIQGENHPNSLINKVSAACIKILLKYTDLTHQEIADSIPGATKYIVDDISSGKTWTYVNIYDFKNGG